ncbi:thioesterase [Mycolicibacterium fortuitum]|uniref:Thioesterase n=1 Tax=Mycolicibacterium fortuitum TaxID=1766 RepID=A0A378UD41_MYCFO|nr:thioesterase [Mycolicibacterium fortuitum]
MLGEVAASDSDRPRFTGTLTIRYLRATPLGDLHAEGRITRTDGIKAFASGHVSDDQGITAEAEGVFILPKWARG